MFEGRARAAQESASVNLERILGENVSFNGIDLERPEQAYHQDMVRGLLVMDEAGASLARRVLQAKGRERETLEHVTVERIIADDISHGIGEKRNVDRFTFMFQNGTEEAFTVSLDIEPFSKEHESASLAETRAIQGAKRLAPEHSSIQAYYGTAILRGPEGARGLVCKEYLPGRMLREVLTTPEASTPEGRETIAEAVGTCFGKALTELGGAPVDMHSANIIMARREDGTWNARLCDVEYVRNDQEGIDTEIRRLKGILKGANEAFDHGMDRALQTYQRAA